MYPPSGFRSNFDDPTVYQITVQGMIASDWSKRLEGMAIKHTALDDGTPITILIGELSDQAALSGVLNTIYELHLSLIAVIKRPQVITKQEEARPADDEPKNGLQA
jgi:hypothetical protein